LDYVQYKLNCTHQRNMDDAYNITANISSEHFLDNLLRTSRYTVFLHVTLLHERHITQTTINP